MFKKILMISIVCSSMEVVAFKWHYVEPNQVKRGHLALPTSQEIGPLYAFGQNIVNKSDKQLFAYINGLYGKNFSFTELRPSFLYGITDYCSLFVELPIAVNYTIADRKFAGVENITFQFEGAVIDTNTVYDSYQLTLVTNVAFPISTLDGGRPIASNASAGSGQVSFLVGATACYMSADWYLFTCQGGIFSATRRATKSGNTYLYQFGASRSWGNYPGWIFAGMVELFGQYSARDTTNGIIDANSGGNSIFLGPSIWASSQRFIGQIGVAFAVTQKLFGNQSKVTWYPAIDLGWKF